jgi:uncharacterized protein (DUF427 family)
MARPQGTRRSGSANECPFKGHASYYSLNLGERQLDDDVWTYEDPYEELLALKDRVAFHDDKFPEIHLRPKR